MHIGPAARIAPERQPDRIDAVGPLAGMDDLAAHVGTAITQLEDRLRMWQPLRTGREATGQRVDVIGITGEDPATGIVEHLVDLR